MQVYPLYITPGSILNFYGKHALCLGNKFVDGCIELLLRTCEGDFTLIINSECAKEKLDVRFLAKI